MNINNLKVFKFHWLDNTTTIREAKSVSEAAGIGFAGLDALDYYEELKELPINEKIIFIKGEKVYNQDLINKFRDTLKDMLDITAGTDINFEACNRKFSFKCNEITGTCMNFDFNKED